MTKLQPCALPASQACQPRFSHLVRHYFRNRLSTGQSMSTLPTPVQTAFWDSLTHTKTIDGISTIHSAPTASLSLALCTLSPCASTSTPFQMAIGSDLAHHEFPFWATAPVPRHLMSIACADNTSYGAHIESISRMDSSHWILCTTFTA